MDSHLDYISIYIFISNKYSDDKRGFGYLAVKLDSREECGGFAEGEIEEREERDADEFTGEDVPGPGTEKIEERGGEGFGAEEHVVGFEEIIKATDEGGVEIENDNGAPDRAGAWAELARPDEEEKARDDETVIGEELDGEKGGGVGRKVGREERLGGSGDAPVPGEVEGEFVEGEESDEGEDERGVAELEREMAGEGKLAVVGEVGVVDGVGDEEQEGHGVAGEGRGGIAALDEGEEEREERDGGEDEEVSGAEEVEDGWHGTFGGGGLREL